MNRSTILYVEDEEDFQKLVSTILGEAGLHVRVAGTGQEGLRMLEREKPGLLMLDINLPDANGYTICERLRQEREWADLPILMVTVRRRPEEWLTGFSSGADDYVSKPLNPPELLERVQACLEGKGARTGVGPATAEYQLIQAALAGNRGAFEVLIRQYRVPLLRSIAQQVRNTALAEDVVSSAFTIALKQLNEFRGDSAFYTWLYGIALRELHRHWRRPSTFPLNESCEETENNWLAESDPAFEAMENQPDLARVRKVVSRVPRFYRTLLKWHVVKGMSHEEIARRLALPTGTVWSRLYKAKRLLRDAWDQMPGSPSDLDS